MEVERQVWTLLEEPTGTRGGGAARLAPEGPEPALHILPHAAAVHSGRRFLFIDTLSETPPVFVRPSADRVYPILTSRTACPILSE